MFHIISALVFLIILSPEPYTVCSGMLFRNVNVNALSKPQTNRFKRVEDKFQVDYNTARVIKQHYRHI